MPLPVRRSVAVLRSPAPPPGGPVLAAVDDSARAVPVVLEAARLAAATGAGLVVATVFAVPLDVPGAGTPLARALVAYEEAVAVLERVRPALDRRGVPYQAEVLGCSGRGGRTRQDRRIAGQLLRLRAERAAAAVVVGLPAAGRISGGGVAGRVVDGVPTGVTVTFGIDPRPVRARHETYVTS